MAPDREFNPLCPYIQRGTRLTADAVGKLEAMNRTLHRLRSSLVEAGDEPTLRSVDFCLDMLEEAFPDPGAKT